MPKHYLDIDPKKHKASEDWEGNNAAFQCPKCGKVFIVTDNPIVPKSHEERGIRRCPACRESIAHCHGGRQSGGISFIEW